MRRDISDRLPNIPEQKNGKKIACIGAGCASLTVANDLLPLGYDCTIFEALAVPGGLMRSNIPASEAQPAPMRAIFLPFLCFGTTGSRCSIGSR